MRFDLSSLRGSAADQYHRLMFGGAGDSLDRYLAGRRRVQRNMNFWDGSPFIFKFLKQAEENPKGFDLAKETVSILGNAHLRICYCCPFVEGTISELKGLEPIIKKIDGPKKICSAGLLANMATWRRLLKKYPEERIGNGLQHCISRMAAIATLWPAHLSQKSIETSIAFVLWVRVTIRPRLMLRQMLLDSQDYNFSDRQVRKQFYELAGESLNVLARTRKSGKLTWLERTLAWL